MTVGERVKFLRGKKNLADFGAELGVSGTQISRIETDQSKPSVDLATKICEMYNVTLDWLFARVEFKGMPEQSKQIEEPKSDMIYVSKDEFIELQRKALRQEEEKVKELNQKIKELKND